VNPPQAASMPLEHGMVKISRICRDLGWEIAEFASSCLEHHDTRIQHLAVQKFLGHTSMKDMILPWMIDLDTIKLQHSVLSSMKEGVRDHLLGVRESAIVMAKDILCTLASSSKVGSGREVARLLGVDRRNISKARSRRMVLDGSQDAFWLYYRRKVRSDSLGDNVKVVVKEWWASKTTVSPNCKDISSFHEGLRQWVSHPTHFFQCSQVQLPRIQILSW
jgi:hypothetical protein